LPILAAISAEHAKDGQTNTHVGGTGIVALNPGNDTNLKGAVVSGASVIANVGHDLNIESQQDSATY
jgi:filamentous hemagglutinin